MKNNVKGERGMTWIKNFFFIALGLLVTRIQAVEVSNKGKVFMQGNPEFTFHHSSPLKIIRSPLEKHGPQGTLESHHGFSTPLGFPYVREEEKKVLPLDEDNLELLRRGEGHGRKFGSIGLTQEIYNWLERTLPNKHLDGAWGTVSQEYLQTEIELLILVNWWAPLLETQIRRMKAEAPHITFEFLYGRLAKGIEKCIEQYIEQSKRSPNNYCDKGFW